MPSIESKEWQYTLGRFFLLPTRLTLKAEAMKYKFLKSLVKLIIFCLFSIYLNPNTDDSIFDCLLTNMVSLLLLNIICK